MNPTPYYESDGVTLHLGSCLDILPTLPDNSVDAVVTDPPYGLGFMGKAWDSSGIAYNTEVWRQCWRVLKPGGHLVAFGGTRTYHRMTVAIEDAGFEIRDSLHWMYGAGFPKSLDVSKAIDKAAGAQRELLGPSRHHSPGRTVEWGNGTTYGTQEAKGKWETAPATEDASRWEGWGTALKPAHEPIVWAQKPFSPVPLDVWLISHVHHALGGLIWLSLSPATRAELSSQSRNPGPDEATCVSALVSAALATSPDESARTDTFSSPATASTFWNIAGSWNAILAALSDPTTTSTTATASSTTTGLKTLSSLLGPITSPTTMPKCGCLLDGKPSPAASAEPSSSAEWSNWIDTLRLSVPETAIEGIALAVSSALASVAEDLSNGPAAESTAQRSAQTEPPTRPESSRPSSASAAGEPTSRVGTPGSTARASAQGLPLSASSAHEPIVLARKPLAGTVAGTVLAHGTGALNIGGCRVGAETRVNHAGGASSLQRVSRVEQGYRQNVTTSVGEASEVAGRWPSNVILTHPPIVDEFGQPVGDACADGCVPGCPVAELDRQSGVLTSGRMRAGIERANREGWAGPMPATTGGETYGDTGGASRFFHAFRYEAKAPTSERPRLPDGTTHATVKPVSLMSWLVRLVTPPGGTVLEPFAGSGTTLEACVIEGMQVVGIELDEQHAELCKVRLSKPIAGTLFGDVA